MKWRFVWAADLELGDTADSEVCATTEKSKLPKNAACHHTWFRYYIRLPSRRLAGIMLPRRIEFPGARELTQRYVYKQTEIDQICRQQTTFAEEWRSIITGTSP